MRLAAPPAGLPEAAGICAFRFAPVVDEDPPAALSFLSLFYLQPIKRLKAFKFWQYLNLNLVCTRQGRLNPVPLIQVFCPTRYTSLPPGTQRSLQEAFSAR